MNTVEQISSLYEAKHSQREIAGMMGLSLNKVQRTLKKLNLNRSHGEATTLWHEKRRKLGTAPAR